MNELNSGNASVWVPVVRTGDDEDPAARSVRSGSECDWSVPPRACLDVRPDGTLVIGAPDADQDAMLSELLLVDRCGEA